VVVHPTSAGATIFTDIAAHRRGMLQQVLAELTEDEMASLLVGMRAIHAARRRLVAASPDLETVPDAASPPPG
jgi:DNA-binding MarR family transcriptional regulator